MKDYHIIVLYAAANPKLEVGAITALNVDNAVQALTGLNTAGGRPSWAVQLLESNNIPLPPIEAESCSSCSTCSS